MSADGWVGWYAHIGNSSNPMVLIADAPGGNGTFDWKEVSSEFDVPAGCDTLELGTVLWGTGTAWFDDVALDTTATSDLTATADAVETISVTETGANPTWYDDSPADDLHWDYRVPVKVTNLAAAPISGLAQLDLSSLLERKLGLSASSLRVVDGTTPMPAYVLGKTVLFEAQAGANAVHTYYLYLSTDTRIAAAPASGYDGLLASGRNLVQNPSFETGDPAADGMDDGRVRWRGAVPRHAGQVRGEGDEAGHSHYLDAELVGLASGHDGAAGGELLLRGVAEDAGRCGRRGGDVRGTTARPPAS